MKSEKRERKLTSHRETSKSPLSLQVLGLPNGGFRREYNRIQDESVLESLDLSHHLRLVLRRAVVVDNTQTTQKSHVDGHVVLGHSVHGRRHKGCLQSNALGNGGIKSNIRSREACARALVDANNTSRVICLHTDVAGQDQEVVVSQCTMFVRIQQSVNVKTISGRVVLLQDIEGLGVVLNLGLHDQALVVTLSKRHSEKIRRS